MALNRELLEDVRDRAAEAADLLSEIVEDNDDDVMAELEDLYTALQGAARDLGTVIQQAAEDGEE